MRHIGIDISRMAVLARTGTEHYTYELLGAIARQDRRSRYTLYCSTLPAALPLLGPNMALRQIPFPRLWTHARLSAEVIADPPDTLFVPAHVVPLGMPLSRARAVVTIHDLGYLHFPEAHPPAQRRYLRRSTIWSARAAHHVIAISQATKDDLVRAARIDPAKVTVIPHGVSPRFRPPPAVAVVETRERYGLHKPYIFYVGTVQPRKNLVRLIEAVAQLGDLAEPPLLAIAGKRGWLTETIERRAAELGVTDRVRFLGYVADADLPALIGGAAVFALPSLYEGFGMPVLEAFACGAPVLTANTSALPEVVGAAALLVDPLDVTAIAAGLRSLLTDADLRAELRERGLARAAGYTWERTAAETLAVIRGAV